MGTLFIVATPIGNLSDITLRAIEILKSSDLILSEDTRETSKVLAKYDIQARQISYRDQIHGKVAGQIIEMLKAGNNISLVSDSGTPLISDPGFKLVEEARKEGVNVVPIPGPSAVTAALSAAGLPTDKFAFLGFLPKKSAQIQKMIKTYGSLDATLVIYESPFRVRRLLEDVLAVLGNRKVAVCREMTKMHEEIIVGPVSEVLDKKFKEKGEFVILIAKEGY